MNLKRRILLAYRQVHDEQRFLHWKAQDLYKLSPRGIRVTSDRVELDREFPEE